MSVPMPTKDQKSRLARRSRTKGATFERVVAGRLAEVWPNAKRGLGQPRAGGEVPDVSGTPYWVEIKHRKRPNIAAAVEQARVASAGRSAPLAVTRANNGPVLVTMLLDDWIELAQTAHRYDTLDEGKVWLK